MSFTVKTSLLDRSDGSAQLVIGKTKVVTSVTGPIEARARQELPTQAALEIVIRPAVGLATTREKLLEDKLRSLLQAVIIRYKYPRQLIQIVVQFLTTEGTSSKSNEYTNNELNAALNACYFALVDANIALYSSFVSLSISLCDNKIIYYPTLAQLQASDSHHVVCFSIEDRKANKLLLLESQGDFKEDELFHMISEAVTECENIHEKYQRKYIADKVEKDFIWKN
jgi:exosome complex component RRP46